MEHVSAPVPLSQPAPPISFFVFTGRALYEDACLYLVPNSHRLPRTDAQRALSMTLESPNDPLAMPDAIRLTLHRKSLPSSLSL